MPATKRSLLLFISAGVLVLMAGWGCSSPNSTTAPNPARDPIQENMEQASTLIARSVLEISSKLVSLADTLRGQSFTPVPRSSVPVYDPKTGWWSVDLTLETGQTMSARFKFEDASGNAQRFYHPATTHRIRVEGTAEGPDGTITYTLDLKGTETASESVTVQGNGTFTYMGISGDYHIDNVVIPKSQGAFPTSGSITAEAASIAVTITFSGTRFAEGTYTYKGLTFHFTIDLETGEIQHS